MHNEATAIWRPKVSCGLSLKPPSNRIAELKQRDAHVITGKGRLEVRPTKHETGEGKAAGEPLSRSTCPWIGRTAPAYPRWAESTRTPSGAVLRLPMFVIRSPSFLTAVRERSTACEAPSCAPASQLLGERRQRRPHRNYRCQRCPVGGGRTTAKTCSAPGWLRSQHTGHHCPRNPSANLSSGGCRHYRRHVGQMPSAIRENVVSNLGDYLESRGVD